MENKILEFQVWTWYEIWLSTSHSLIKTVFRAAIGIVTMTMLPVAYHLTCTIPPQS